MQILTYSDIPGTGDIKSLNYALVLQAMETDLYSQSLLRLTTGGRNPIGTQIPGFGYIFSQQDVKYVNSIAQVEVQHRDYLHNSLGNFSILGRAAYGMLNNVKFDFGIQDMTHQQILQNLYQMESTGVQACLGTMRNITTSSTIATINAIQNSEARHAAVMANINNSLGFTPLDPSPRVGQISQLYGVPNSIGLDGTLDPNVVLANVSPWIVF